VNANISAKRGRPRGFDTEAALEIGQRMFHAHGYDAVGLAALTDALGIKPPSFYKAFGSKAEFFSRVLDRYLVSPAAVALDGILCEGRSPRNALAEFLERAAQTYARDPELRGCLVLEAARAGGDDEAAALARRLAAQRRDEIRAFVAHSHPDVADAVTDYVACTMSGLSASAREGMTEARLVTVAKAAAAGLEALLAKPARRRAR
jgi:TetR/AcrR family transcriptional repressor for divergent bdcA